MSRGKFSASDFGNFEYCKRLIGTCLKNQIYFTAFMGKIAIVSVALTVMQNICYIVMKIGYM